MAESKARKIARLERTKDSLNADSVELWMRQHAKTVKDARRRAGLLTIANERRTNTKRAIEKIEVEIELLQDD
jgi:hypothetical protein